MTRCASVVAKPVVLLVNALAAKVPVWFNALNTAFSSRITSLLFLPLLVKSLITSTLPAPSAALNTNASFPVPPIRTSLPVPPLTTSLPVPPMITSLPAPPVNTSLPPLPLITSLPPLPVSVLPLPLPLMVCPATTGATGAATAPIKLFAVSVCVPVRAMENSAPVLPTVLPSTRVLPSDVVARSCRAEVNAFVPMNVNVQIPDTSIRSPTAKSAMVSRVPPVVPESPTAVNTNTSLPAPPINESAPVPPTRVSLPAPPLRVSLPAPPSSESLPALPTRLSVPSAPLSVSVPPAPVNTLLPALPVPLKLPVPSYVRFSMFVPLARLKVASPSTCTRMVSVPLFAASVVTTVSVRLVST